MSTTTSPAPGLTDEIARRGEMGHPSVSRDETIKAIRAALKRRSGKAWSVTGGRGTAWGWINITAPPRRCTGRMIQHAEQRDGRTHYEYEHIDTSQPTGDMTPRTQPSWASCLDSEGLSTIKASRSPIARLTTSST